MLILNDVSYIYLKWVENFHAIWVYYEWIGSMKAYKWYNMCIDNCECSLVTFSKLICFLYLQNIVVKIPYGRQIFYNK